MTIIIVKNEEAVSDIEQIADTVRANTVLACVAWLAINHAEFKPEYLAGELASAFLENPNDPQ